jgi:hypothetical protein
MSPGHEERRPRQETAQSSTKTTKHIFPQSTDIPRRRTAEQEAAMRELAAFLGQCRRRREDAALRLPPLADGRRDPIAPITDGADVR